MICIDALNRASLYFICYISRGIVGSVSLRCVSCDCIVYVLLASCSYTWSGVLCPHSRRPAAAALSPRSRGYRSVGAWTMVVGRDGRRLGRPWPCAYSSCRTGGKHHPMCLSTDLTRAWLFLQPTCADRAMPFYTDPVGSWFGGCYICATPDAADPRVAGRSGRGAERTPYSFQISL